jgi:hypothetical protein
VNGGMVSTHFHPQRLLPRYSGLISRLSRSPGGLKFYLAPLGPLVNSHEHSTSENPTSLDLELARVVVCGFPRTGTTFLQTAIQDVFEDSTACWKNHDVLAIPRYLRRGIPTVVTLREPLATAVSWSIYNADEPKETLLAGRLLTYASWHEQIPRYLESRLLRLKRFEDFRDHPFEILSPVLQQIAAEEELHHVDARQINEELEHSNAEHGISVLHGNTPSIDRRELREQYVKLSSRPRVAEALERATVIFSDLNTLSLHRPSLDPVSLAAAQPTHTLGTGAATLTGIVASGAAGAGLLLRLLGD